MNGFFNVIVNSRNNNKPTKTEEKMNKNGQNCSSRTRSELTPLVVITDSNAPVTTS